MIGRTLDHRHSRYILELLRNTSMAGNMVFTSENGPTKRRSEADDQQAADCFLHEGQPAPGRAQDARALGEGEAVSPDSRRARGPPYVRAARWAAVRQWTDSPGNRV